MTHDDIMALTVFEFSTLISRLDLVKPPILTRPTAVESTFQSKAYLDFRGKKPVVGFGETYLDALANAVVHAWKTRQISEDWRPLCLPR